MIQERHNVDPIAKAISVEFKITPDFPAIVPAYEEFFEAIKSNDVDVSIFPQGDGSGIISMILRVKEKKPKELEEVGDLSGSPTADVKVNIDPLLNP